MSKCNRCSARTTRRRLCPHCAIDERYGQALIDEEQTREKEETMMIECAGCGLIHEVGVSSRKTCPDCSYEGYRPVEALR